MDERRRIQAKGILGCLLLGISIMMLFKSLMLCFSADIWYDELFTVGMIEHSCSDLIGFTARDVHPPLYYLIVKFFVDLCKLISDQADTVVIAKIVSVLPYVILLLYCLVFIRKRFGIFTGGLFLFCAVAMPQLSGYLVEVRMYSFALLFVTAAFLHAYGAVTASGQKPEEGPCFDAGKSGRKTAAHARSRMRQLHGAALVFYGLAAAYTQYFACVAVVMIYLSVLFVFWARERERIKEWLLWVLLSVIGYAPWLFALYSQITTVRENYWILPLTWRSLGGCVKFLMKPAFTNGIVAAALAVVLFAVYVFVVLQEIGKLFHYVREKARNNGNISVELMQRPCLILAGIGTLAAVVLFGFAASILLRPIFVYRYMISAMGCFWLSFAVGLDGMWHGYKDGKNIHHLNTEESKLCQPSGKSFLYAQIFCMAASAFVILVGLRDYRAFMGEEEYKILQMEQTQKALSAIAPQDIVLYNFDQVQAVASYYLDDETESYLWCGTPEALIQEIIRPFGSVEQTEQIKEWCEEGRQVWFIGSFNSREDIAAEWEADGLKVYETGSYLLERYWFNLYKISLERS